ncbi:MAG: ABC transporter ATP-binding protein [Acidimicrobiales bacterium]
MALLEAHEISKRFGRITALDTISIDADSGEAIGLIGPNGAGKTTLFNCLLGILRPDSGSVVFDGVRLDHLPTHRRSRLGLARTFQRMELFTGMTVREHLFVAGEAATRSARHWWDVRGWPWWWQSVSPDERSHADETISLLGLDDVADTVVEALTLGQGRLVELGRALASRPRLLMLDEPSSGLDANETAALAGVLRRVREEHGTTIVLVEHDLHMVSQVVDRVIVLVLGRLVAEGTMEEVMASPMVRDAYLGAP